MKILVVFGTRPEAIKMAPICLELKKRKFPFKICVTAQHREMLDQVLDFFELVPDFDLNLMKPNQCLNELSAQILSNINTVLVNERFDLVLVHGDTTTSTIVALAAFHKGIKVGHVEAGLRTFNKLSPFPEELNRQITSRIADFHFAPTTKALENLLNEGVSKENCIETGNTVIDALKFTISKIENGYSNTSIISLKHQLNFNKKIILVTGHRRESFGNGFKNLCSSILEISNREDIEILYPVHLNPNVQNVVYKMLSNKPNIHLITPLDYPSFVWLMSEASLIISDSGGLQEEAPTFKVPVLVTRETTEREEGIQEGFSVLVGTDTKKIVSEATKLINNPINFENKENPYGNGLASKMVVAFIKKMYKNQK